MRNSKTLENKKLTISGTYGDKVRLVIDGYISTKYGDFFKIINVDVEKNTIKTYGGGDYDFSRISSSCTKKQGDKFYLEYIDSYFKRLNIRNNTILKYEDKEYKVDEIILPSLTETDFLPKIVFVRTDGLELKMLKIEDFEIFSRQVEIIHSNLTLEEKIEKHLKESLNFNDTLKNKEEYLKKLIEIIHLQN